MKLIPDIDFNNNGVPDKELKENLRHLIQTGMNEGLATGLSPATADQLGVSVREVT